MWRKKYRIKKTKKKKTIFEEEESDESRIVGGEDVNKQCMRRPFLALIK